MSTRVFKPIYANEYVRMRSPISVSDRRLPIKATGKVKRVLFEPIDHEETQNFLRFEFAEQSKLSSEKWEFDFAKGKPLSPKGTDGRYEWCPVTPPASCPAPKRRRNDEFEQDITDLYCETANIVKPTPLRADQSISSEASESPSESKKQCLITDFMAMRKRNRDSAFAKKTTVAPRPPKIARSNDVAS